MNHNQLILSKLQEVKKNIKKMEVMAENDLLEISRFLGFENNPLYILIRESVRALKRLSNTVFREFAFRDQAGDPENTSTGGILGKRYLSCGGVNSISSYTDLIGKNGFLEESRNQSQKSAKRLKGSDFELKEMRSKVKRLESMFLESQHKIFIMNNQL